jgi:hypothetical protein
MERKKEDTGEFDVYCVLRAFCVSRVRKFGRRSVGVCARSTRRAAATTERKRSAVAEKERTRRSSEKKKDFSFFRVPWT